METNRTLIRKLTNIMQTLGPLPRTGEKKGQTRAGGEFGYAVFLESDIVTPIQRALAAHGIVIVPEVMALDRRELPADRPDRAPVRLVDVLVKFTVHDADSGETLAGQAPGSAEERDGTGVSKAFTDANKNWLRKIFEIAADEQGKAPRASQSRQAARPAPASPDVSPTPANTPALISEPQRKRLWALCKEHGVEADKLKDHIFPQFNFVTSKDITRASYDGVCKWVAAGGRPVNGQGQ